MGIMSHKIKHINDEVEITFLKKEPYKFYGRIILILGKRKKIHLRVLRANTFGGRISKLENKSIGISVCNRKK